MYIGSGTVRSFAGIHKNASKEERGWLKDGALRPPYHKVQLSVHTKSKPVLLMSQSYLIGRN
jgi:hypothetical protein